ncbi:MAG: asparagine synthase (glutamine-hydrolyzing) [Acidobacteriia bacterium]|nr:asparagine synthase (glutamine-hydrolyzing) [Terriglobia bacterium]
MCGIVGWHSSEDVPGGPVLLKRMLSAIIHRGPDEEGQFIKGPIALGIRRLSIIDVEGGHQPIANEDRTVWVVLNGEIYNFRELRSELEAKGHVFATRSDTEVIVHGYEEWGDECIARLNGIFAFAVWDSRRQRLLLARDPFGVKPLYYYCKGRRLVWASEVKALLSDPSIPRQVDLDALDLFLTFRFVPSPLTMFAGIRKVPPGHCVIKDEKGCRSERYVSIDVACDERLTEKDWIALLQERLEAAVKRQMMSDVPIGALLSGGVDSGVVVALMSRFTDRPVRTFTVGFADSDDINELKEARRTAVILGTAHEEVLLTSLDYRQLLRKVTWHLDEPIATTSALAMYSVCKLAREHVTVVLTGQGADEPFAAYPRYLGELYGALYRRLPTLIRERVVRPLVDILPRSERLKRAVHSLGTEDTTDRFARVYAVFSKSKKDSMWQPGLVGTDGPQHVRGVIDYWRRGVEHLDPLVQMTHVDARLSLSDDLLTYGDKMSMAASIEARVPFLDLDYMRVVEALPPALRIHGITQKYIHKKAIAKWLPAEIIRRRKRGFDTPVDRWFRSELSGYVRSMLLSRDAACLLFFQRQGIEALLEDHLSGREDNRRQLFSLLVFELWYQQFISSQQNDELTA